MSLSTHTQLWNRFPIHPPEEGGVINNLWNYAPLEEKKLRVQLPLVKAVGRL